MSDRPLCVLSIAHPAIKRDSGRLRYDPLAARTDLDLHLLVPSRWHQFGRVLTAETAADSDIQLEIAPISLAKAGPLSWYLHFYPGLRRLVRRLDPDVIHLWEEPWSVVALQACLLKGRAALVLEVDQNIVKRLPPPFEALRRFVLRRTAHVLCRSPDAAAVVRANGYTGPVSFIGYGVDQNLFHAADTAAAAQLLCGLATSVALLSRRDSTTHWTPWRSRPPMSAWPSRAKVLTKHTCATASTH